MFTNIGTPNAKYHPFPKNYLRFILRGVSIRGKGLMERNGM